MKWLVTVLAAVAAGGGIFAAPRHAPSNPRFADWQRRHLEGKTAGGLIPSPVDRSYLTKACRDFVNLKKASQNRQLLKSADAGLPSRWDSRDRDWVTPVKNQGSWGACWTFSTMACLETADLKATGGAVTNDFSENHLAAHTVGFSREVDFDAGGNDAIALALLTAWRDPLNESEDPYPHPDSRVDLPAARHVQSATFIPGRADAKDNDLLKQAVMEYGAVSVSYYDSGFYRNQQTGAYCYSGERESNHAVTLIGWDDDYSTDNFLAGHRPPENGAFLIKNSWGAGAGTNGFLWISYFDSSFAKDMSAVYPQPEATNNYGRVYQHDPCGWIMEYASGGNENWCANVFTADATGVVSAVGFYAVAPGVFYTIRICTNCTGDPSSGTVVSEQTGTFEHAGYYTVPLRTEVPVRRVGERFAVVLRLSTELYEWPLPVECSYEGYCTADALPGQSYWSTDGRTWADLQEVDPTANFCVKAYTKYGSDGGPHVPTTVFVDAASAADEPDGSCERPFREIASALEVALKGDRILVAPGRYYGCVEAPEMPVLITSSDGPEVTFIDGGGCDCCYYDESSQAELSGFTLENGGEYGGAFGGCLSNCVIRDCRSTATDMYRQPYGGGGAFAAVLTDCVISNCTAYFGGGASWSELVNCLVVGNRAEAYRTRLSWDGGTGGGIYDCLLANCTVAGNSAALFGGGAYLDSEYVAVNTIVATNVCDRGFDYGNDIYGMGYYETVCSISDQDAKFVDAANGDWRLSARSPCIDAGSNAFVCVEHDLDGTNRIAGARVDMGCYEYCRAVPGWAAPDVAPDASPSEEASAVAAAMRATGFSKGKAGVLSSVAQYAAFSDWVAGRGLSTVAVDESPTAFVSAALDAPGLLALSAQDLRMLHFAPTGEGTSWRMRLALEAYDPARVNPALLRAAVGIVGSVTPAGDYSAAGLDFAVTPGSDGVDVTVAPPPGKDTYFMRGFVR